MALSAKNQYFGIDLGTTNSIIAWGEQVRVGSKFRINPKPIEIMQGPYRYDYLPSVVHFGEDGNILIGQPAKDRLSDPERVCKSCKLKLGTTTKYRRNGKEYTPTDISAMVLARLKAAAEKTRNTDAIRDVVVTVPASFDTDKRVETINAARIAFYDETSSLGDLSVHLLDEPTAALLAFLDDQKEASDARNYVIRFDGPKNILIFDFGGGTLDISVVRVELSQSGAGFKISPLGLSRYTEIGGDDLDMSLGINFLMEHATNCGVDVSSVDRHTLQIAKRKFAVLAEKAKIDLQNAINNAFDFKKGLDHEKVREIKINCTAAGLGIPGFPDRPFEKSLSLGEFEDILERFLHPDGTHSLFAPIRDTMSKGGLDRFDIDYVLLVGGSSQLYSVKRTLARFFGFELGDGRLLESLDPMRAVARGAVIQNHFIQTGYEDGIGVPPTLAESLKLQVEDAGERAFVSLIKSGEVLPIVKERIKTFSISTPGRGEDHLSFRIYRGDGSDLTELHSKTVYFQEPQKRKEKVVCSVDMRADKVLRFSAHLESRESDKFEIRIDDGFLTDAHVQEARARIFNY
ncbi:MAG: Hsp70 family protein [Planctomycetes bacterium]|nr:Hsp70 family protein [Planctomycetota bacterium]